MNYDTRVKGAIQNRGLPRPVKAGFIALMATIIISLILLVMVVQEGTSGWYARFNILGTESKEQANSLAEGCASQALAALVTDPYYAGDSTSTSAGGTCHTFPIQFNTPAAGLVTISTQAQVRGSFANLAAVMNLASVHVGSTPASPTRGTLIVYTHVINDNGGASAAAAFTENVAATAPSKFLFGGSEGGVAVTMTPGAYSITENSLSGYSESLSTGCSGTIAAGEVKSCVITNDDVLTTLTVIANIINNNGGIHVLGDFIVYIDGVAKTAGQPIVVNAGAHTVSGTNFAGYSSSVWGYNCAASGSLTVNSGDNKTCIITYDDNPPAAPICADTVMMLDRTGSMSSSDLSGEKTAANALINLYSGVTPLPKIGVGIFGDGSDNNGIAPAKVVGTLSTAYSSLTSAVNTWLADSEGNTNLGDAITKANDELNSVRHTAGNAKVLVLVSDGDPNRPTGGAAFETGFMPPAANAQNAAGDLWSNPAGAYNTSDATSTAGAGKRERYSVFGLSPALPAGSTVTGVEAEVSSWATASTVTGPVTNNAKSPSAALAPNQWTNPTRASASDDSYATSVTNGNQQGYSNFGFAVPANATITGVGVTAEAKITGTGSASTATLFSNGQGNYQDWNGSENDIDETGNPACGAGGSQNEHIDSNNSSNRESVNIDLGSVPNGSVVTSVQVLAWDQGSSGATYQTFIRVNGSNTNASGNLTATSATGCVAHSQTIAADFIKTSGTDFEVGVQKVGNNPEVRVGALRAIVTYTPATTGSLTLALSSNNGAAYTATKTASVASAEAAVIPGGNNSSDVWGRTWVPADFNNGNFALRVQNTSATGPTVSLDQLVVTVFYTLPVSAPVACQLGMDLSWNGGTSWSSEKTQTLSGTEELYTLGGSSDKWGSHNWAIGDFSDTNFRARIHGIDPGSACDNAAIDHVDDIKIKVDYTQPTDPVSFAYAAADAAKQSGTSIFTIYFGSGNPDLLARLASGSTANGSHQPGSFNDPGGVASGNTGFVSPTAQVADTGGDGNGFEVNPANAFADGPSGTSGAAQNIDGAGDRQRYYGYNFNVPPGATINGIQTRLDWWLDSTSGTNSMDAQLSWDGGATWTSSKNENNESTSVSHSDTLGSSSDTWGHVWTADQLSAANFRVRLTSNSTTASRDFFLDWVPVEVSYTVNAENGDGDDFFIAPTSADMAGIFNFIGSQVCPASVSVAATPPPTTATLFISTSVINDNGTGSKTPSDFTTNVSAANASQTSFAGSSGGTSVTIDPGNYSVTETGVSGYTQRPSATCSSSASGAIVAGETRTCTLVNDDIPPPPAPPNLTITTGSFEEVPDPQ